MPDATRYAIVGAGSRGRMFLRATAETYADSCRLVGLCDINPTRLAYYNRWLTDRGRPTVPAFPADRFDEMIGQVRPDRVIVTTPDRDHDRYIVRAMELGCDAITEKPLTTDEHKCRAILDAIGRTGRACTVTFNARYGPADGKVKELLAGGVIGRVLSVNYEHLLDIDHGADYFRRWHRAKANSGGLMVHKCTHCFDLVNWWIGAVPQTVFAVGKVDFYGDRNGHGPAGRSDRCHTCPAGQCRFRLRLADKPILKAMYLDAEKDDGYIRDQCVFGGGVTTEDSVAVIVTYDSGATLSYHLNAFSPYEASRIVFNGTTGRLELEAIHTRWIERDRQGTMAASGVPARIEVFPHHGSAYKVDCPTVAGEHGGADAAILAALFGPPAPDPLGRRAAHLDGARSILVGIAANRSMERGQPVRIDDLVKLGS